MMEGAYFVGRNELLNWLNDLLSLGYTKVEQTASGASHCQVMDAIHPGKVPLHKVNFNAKFEYEYVKNFKVLQEVFNKLGVDKFIDVQKLIKAKYQDNLEFLQWIKRYYDIHFPGDKYNAVERRKESKCAYDGDSKLGGPQELNAGGARASGKAESKGESAIGAPGRVKTTRPAAAAPTKAASVLKTVNRDISKPIEKVNKPAEKSHQAAPAAEAKLIENEYKAKIADMNQQIVQLKLTIDGLEKDRDFYFNKLREVEILCQNNSSDSVVEDVLKILYATDDENFAADGGEE